MVDKEKPFSTGLVVTSYVLAASDLQLPLRQWGTGNVYLLVLSKAKSETLSKTPLPEWDCRSLGVLMPKNHKTYIYKKASEKTKILLGLSPHKQIMRVRGVLQYIFDHPSKRGAPVT